MFLHPLLPLIGCVFSLHSLLDACGIHFVVVNSDVLRCLRLSLLSPFIRLLSSSCRGNDVRSSVFSFMFSSTQPLPSTWIRSRHSLDVYVFRSRYRLSVICVYWYLYSYSKFMSSHDANYCAFDSNRSLPKFKHSLNGFMLNMHFSHVLVAKQREMCHLFILFGDCMAVEYSMQWISSSCTNVTSNDSSSIVFVIEACTLF